MSNNTRLCFEGKNGSPARDIRLIGTAHISAESIAEVTEAIRSEMPGMVCVELDAGRYDAMNRKDAWDKLNVSKVLREGKGFLLVANIALAGFQRRLGGETGVKPGAEMIAAVDAAKELGLRFAFCDREIQVTLRRAWAKCGPLARAKLVAALFSSAFAGEKLAAEEIENLKQSNELDNMMKELSDYLPAVKETLIDERDLFLAAKIWAAAGVGGSTVAVVGAGHLQGIRAWFERFAEASGIEATDVPPAAPSATGGADLPAPPVDLSELESIPPKTALAKCAKWIVPAAILSLIAFGFWRAGAGLDLGLQMLIRWVLWNGSLSALGAIIALGHPLAILTAFAAAPFTSGNPFISSGIMAGIVQTAIRKPRVADAENIAADISSLKGLYGNRITRALLVFLLSSLGSALATLPALLSIAGLLGNH